MKLEIDDLERRAIERSLVERRSRLIEKAGDTTLTPARRQASYRELSAIASALRKLRNLEPSLPNLLQGFEGFDGGIRDGVPSACDLRNPSLALADASFRQIACRRRLAHGEQQRAKQKEVGNNGQEQQAEGSGARQTIPDARASRRA